MNKAEKFIESALGKEGEPFKYKAGGRSLKGWRIHIPAFNSRDVDQLVESHWREFHARDIRLFRGPGVFRIGPDEYADSWGAVEWYPSDGPPPIADVRESPPTYAQVFALPGLPVLDIVEFCKVGSHNADSGPSDEGFQQAFESLKRFAAEAGPKQMRKVLAQKERTRRAFERMPHGPEPWRMVHQALAGVMEITPFAIQFADEAGLHATFLEKVSARQARKIGNMIVEVNPEAMELPPDDLAALGLSVPMDRKYKPVIPDYEAAMVKYIVSVGKFRMWWD